MSSPKYLIFKFRLIRTEIVAQIYLKSFSNQPGLTLTETSQNSLSCFSHFLQALLRYFNRYFCFHVPSISRHFSTQFSTFINLFHVYFSSLPMFLRFKPLFSCGQWLPHFTYSSHHLTYTSYCSRPPLRFPVNSGSF